MRVLFSIQGEGRGHMTQALTAAKIIRDAGHELVCVLVGKSPQRVVPDFFLEKIGCDIITLDSPNFLPSSKNKKVKLTKSVLYNTIKQHRYIKSILRCNKVIKDERIDLVINFYEIITGLTYGMFRPKAKMICVAHQYMLFHPDYIKPNVNRVELESLKFFTLLTSLGCARIVALSFKSYRPVIKRKMFVMPPLLRESILSSHPIRGNYIHGYMLNSGFSDDIMSWHENHKDEVLHFFWDKQNVDDVVEPVKNVFFHKLNDDAFVKYMVGCKSYVTTAGFESVCEAAYLRKPSMVVPVHIEQECNAFEAESLGVAISQESFNLDAIVDFSKTFKPLVGFHGWVKSAGSHFLNNINAVMGI